MTDDLAGLAHSIAEALNMSDGQREILLAVLSSIFGALARVPDQHRAEARALLEGWFLDPEDEGVKTRIAMILAHADMSRH